MPRLIATTPHYHSDSIITTIYEGTSEIQASFALKEMARGALFGALDETKADPRTSAASSPSWSSRCSTA